MIRLSLLAVALLASSSVAQEPDWTHARAFEVKLSSFDFMPGTIHLRAGEPVVLHLANTSGGGHNFAAKRFFAAAVVRPEEASLVRNGVVEVASRSARDVALVPRAGRYKLKCTHAFHATFGMVGEIVVE